MSFSLPLSRIYTTLSSLLLTTTTVLNVMPPLTLSSTLTLNDGLALPRLGLGVYMSRGSEGKRAIVHALNAGYRHIDTAQLYKNEKECGEALRESGLRREEVWITSKIWDCELPQAEVSSESRLSVEGHNAAAGMRWLACSLLEVCFAQKLTLRILLCSEPRL